MASLQKWRMYQVLGDQYKVNGFIFGDEKKRFPDGSFITTSRVNRINIVGRELVTENTIYVLGEPAE